MSWSDYLSGYIVNNTNQNTGKLSTNICDSGAMIGLDGTLWAATPGFSLDKYSAPVVNDDGSSSTAQIDEFASLHDAFQNHGTTSRPGGIRIHHEKYYIVSYDADRHVMYLRKHSGGACVAKTNNAYIIATFSSSHRMNDASRGQIPQNPGSTNIACESLQEFLLNNNL